MKTATCCLRSSTLPPSISNTAVPNATTSSWNTRIRRCTQADVTSNPVLLLVDMLRSGTSPDEHTYPLILGAVSKSRTFVANPNTLHGQLLKLGFSSDPFIRNALVSAYAGAGDSARALRVFDEAPTNREPIAWTAIVAGMTKHGRAKDGLRFFASMRSVGAPVDAVAVATVLTACGAAAHVWLGRCLHGLYVACGRVPLHDVHIGSALVDMYGRWGHAADARRAFDEMPCRNVVTWTALIACYARCECHAPLANNGSKSGAAWDLFCEMVADGAGTTTRAVIPNQITLTCVLGSVASAGSLRNGKIVHGYIYKRDIWASPAIGAALIDMYAKCGSIEHALDVFRILPPTAAADAYPWTAIITALATHGREREALRLFSAMWAHSHVFPNAVTYLAALSACGHAGLVEEGKTYFAQMRWTDNIEPTEKHYGCMVDLLARAGRFHEALELIGDMPAEPSPATWAALSAGCVTHANLALADAIRDRLLQLGAGSGRLAMLANLYAADGKWEDSARIRKAMREERAKSAGRSWVEVCGGVHEFTASDGSHERFSEIYHVLEVVAVESKRVEDGAALVSACS